ncbi:MAG: helix-turn-helix domain-containing protein [Candidatus Cryosericum sp.]
MNPELTKLFFEYAEHVGCGPSAAIHTLADVLARKSEPIIVEPEDCRSYTVKETADRLHLSSKEVYQLCLDGILRSYRDAGGTRIPLIEIERFETEADAEDNA